MIKKVLEIYKNKKILGYIVNDTITVSDAFNYEMIEDIKEFIKNNPSKVEDNKKELEAEAEKERVNKILDEITELELQSLRPLRELADEQTSAGDKEYAKNKLILLNADIATLRAGL